MTRNDEAFKYEEVVQLTGAYRALGFRNASFTASIERCLLALPASSLPASTAVRLLRDMAYHNVQLHGVFTKVVSAAAPIALCCLRLTVNGSPAETLVRLCRQRRCKRMC